MSTIDHPAHYNMGKIEVIDAIEDWQLDFCLGNAVKYIARAKHKGSELEDLKKARWYLDRAIQRLEGTPALVAHNPEVIPTYVGPFVGRRVVLILEENSGVVTVDDGEKIVVLLDVSGDTAEYSWTAFKLGLKQKWLVWEEEKKDGEKAE